MNRFAIAKMHCSVNSTNVCQIVSNTQVNCSVNHKMLKAREILVTWILFHVSNKFKLFTTTHLNVSSNS